MKAIVLERPREPLRLVLRDIPAASPGQLLLKVRACAVCRTDLHVVDGDLPPCCASIVPGHEIVGEVVACGTGVSEFGQGDRVGVPWLGFTCGDCRYCRAGQENLCDQARFTGYQIDGGFADYAVADARFCFVLPESYGDVEVAPLLCAGLIGYRSLKMAVTPSASAFTVSARRLTSSPRSRFIRDGRFTHSRGRTIKRRKISPGHSAVCGRRVRTFVPMQSWTLHLSSLPWAAWCRRH